MKTLLITTLISISFLIPHRALAQHRALPESALILSRYIQQESVTGHEKRAGEFLSALCREKGLYVEVLSQDEGRYNLAASLYPLSLQKPNIVLLSHIDVVPAGDTTTWKYAPFSGAIAEEAVWGRGAIDVKGIAIMQLMAMLKFKEAAAIYNFPYNVTLLAVSAEEGNSENGAKYVVDTHFKHLNPVLVLGEGGAGVSGLLEKNPDRQVFCISIAEKQVLWLSLTIDIPASGHGSVPPNEYANQVMVKVLNRLLRRNQKIQLTGANEPMFESVGNHEKGLRGVALRNVKFFRPLLTPVFRHDEALQALVTNTITLTRLENPEGATNQIAQKVTAKLDCRLLPGTKRDDFVNRIKKSFRKSPVEVQVELETTAATESSQRNPLFHQFKNAIEEIYPGSVAIPILFPAYTDNNYFRNRGVPVYGIMPVHLPEELLQAIHKNNERLPIRSLELGTEVYYNFLNRVLTMPTLAKN